MRWTWRIVIYAAEIVVGLFLSWFITSYVFLSFWANQWFFNDAVAWAVICGVVTIVTASIYAVHRFIIQQHIGNDA